MILTIVNKLSALGASLRTELRETQKRNSLAALEDVGGGRNLTLFDAMSESSSSTKRKAFTTNRILLDLLTYASLCDRIEGGVDRAESLAAIDSCLHA